MRKEHEIENFEYLSVEDHEELFDINLVAVCVLSEIKIEAYNRDPKYAPRVGFLFRKSKELERIIGQYLAGNISVDPKEFSATVRELKARTKIPY